MKSRVKASHLAVALACMASYAGVAGATTTYHFTQGAAIDSRGGIFATGLGPVTFDFTVANTLAANTIYNFGYSPISHGDSGSVISFVLNGGNAAASFSSSDFPAAYTVYGGGKNTGAVIHVETDGTGAIALYDITISGRSASGPEYLVAQIQHATANQGVAVVESSTNLTYGYSSGSLQCVASCGGSFGVVAGASSPGSPGSPSSAMPEPASWAMMIGGFGMVGGALRRRSRVKASFA